MANTVHNLPPEKFAKFSKLGTTPKKDSVGRTALHYAASWGHADVINAILGSHCDVPKPQWDVSWPNDECTKLVDVQNGSGFTPLHYAVWVGRKEAIKALASYDADLSAKNIANDFDWIKVGCGNTPLHLAAFGGDFDVVKLLLAAHVQTLAQGAEVMQAGRGQWGERHAGEPTGQLRQEWRNWRGLMAYHIALHKGFQNLTELLHPDIPYTFIFSNDDMGVGEVRMYGPPRLMVIAAKSLQQKLVDDLAAVEQGPLGFTKQQLALPAAAPAAAQPLAVAPGAVENGQAGQGPAPQPEQRPMADLDALSMAAKAPAGDVRAAHMLLGATECCLWQRGLSGMSVYKDKPGGGAGRHRRVQSTAEAGTRKLQSSNSGTARTAGSITGHWGDGEQKPSWLRAADGSFRRGSTKRVDDMRLNPDRVRQQLLLMKLASGTLTFNHAASALTHQMTSTADGSLNASRISSMSAALQGPGQGRRGSATPHRPSLHRLLSGRRISRSQSRLDGSSSLVMTANGSAAAATALPDSSASPSPDVSAAATASTCTAGAAANTGGLPIIQQQRFMISEVNSRADDDDDDVDDEATCEICFDAVAVVALQGCGHTLCICCCKEMCKLHHFKPALCPYCRQIICGFERAAAPFIP
eukprot:gene8074-8269_t